MTAERLGLFGGSFDPVHAGHLRAARLAREARALDRVLFTPAARPPHKPGQRLAPAADRVAMLEAALADEPGFELWPVELDRPGPSYSFDTLELLRAAEPDAEIVLVLGDDNLPGLPDWSRVEELLAQVEPVIVRRVLTDAELDAICAGFKPELAARLRAGVLDDEPFPVAATELRAMLARGEDPGALLPRGVAEVARARGCYRVTS